MTNEQQALIISNINAMLYDLGMADKFRLSWDNELENEAIVVGTIANIDTSDEFILGIRVSKGGANYVFCAENSARHFLRNKACVGDYIKVRAYLKPAMFGGEFCYLHVDDKDDILDHIHEG